MAFFYQNRSIFGTIAKNSAKKIFLCLSFSTTIFAAPPEETEPQEKVGNFAVPATMQPGPFLGLGQNIIDGQEALGVIAPGWLVGKDKSYNELFPYFLYAFSDTFTILIATPMALKFKEGQHRSSGTEDVIVQLEYAYYTSHTPRVTHFFTVLGGLYLPSGDENKHPHTGYGAPSFLLGTTAVHLATEWYCYTSYGAFLTTKYDHNSKNGNQFFYQAGFGKNIAYSPNKWILMWMAEFNGWYTQRSLVNGVIDQNSGFSLIEFGPSLFFSTTRFLLQGGIVPIVYQKDFGNQTSYSYFGSFSVGFRFN